MSAFTVGRQSMTQDSSGKTEGGTPADEGAAGAFVKWIPGEAITFYAALLGVGAAQGDVPKDATPDQLLERIDAGSPGWFFVAFGIAAALVALGAVSTPAGQKSRASSIAVRVILALIAFAIWSTALPGSWPYGWNLIRDMGPAYALLLVPVAAIFATVAELLTKKFKL